MSWPHCECCINPLKVYLLVDDNKTLLFIETDFVLQGNDLLHTILNELPFCGHKFLPLICTLVEEARVDLCLFILQRDVAGQHIGILYSFLHVGMPGTVVQHQTSNQPEKKKGPLDIWDQCTLLQLKFGLETYCVSQSVLCFISMISTMYKSMGSLGLAIASTASTTAYRQTDKYVITTPEHQ